MSPFKRGPVYYIEIRWRGFRRFKVSTDTTVKQLAQDMERTLWALRRQGRRDLIGLLAGGRITLPDLHDAYVRGALDQFLATAESPALEVLVETEWLPWLRSPAGVSPRTRRRYGLRTVERYAVSWNGFFEVLPKGRASTLADLTPGFVSEYRAHRKRAVGGRRRQRSAKPLAAGTLNRDLAALGAFLTWCRDVKGLRVDRPRLGREREPRGRERWLSAAELTAFEQSCPREWWPFFATLFYTGARLGEAQGLRGADVLVHAKRITIHESERRVKSRESVRDLPIPKPLERALATHFAQCPVGPADLVFPGPFAEYGAVRRAWDGTCKAAKIAGATPHDARHTFGVHAAQAGVPIVRLQKLLGHATAAMTLRYMQHAPEAYLDEDATAIAAHMEHDTEAEARAVAARSEIRRA